MKIKVIIAVFITIFSISCSVHKVVKKPQHKLNIEESKFENTKKDYKLNSKFWESFEDKKLNEFVNTVFEKNLNLKEAVARLKQMEAISNISKAGYFPTVNISAGAQNTKYSYDAYNILTGTVSDDIDIYSTNLSIGYQLDLWGKIKNGRKAELLNYLSTEKGVESTYLTIAGNAVDLWYSIAEQQMAVELTKEQIKVVSKYLDLINSRAAKGLASLLEVLQQKQVLENIKNQLPAEMMKLEVLKNQLAVLIAENPSNFKFENSLTIPEIKDLPNTGLPSDLLKNRPDVKAAEFALISADHKLAVAIADRFPSISLGINLGSQADSPSNLFDKWFLKLSSDILAPIVDGGRRRNEVKRNKAIVFEKFNSWKLSILNSIKEVEDAIITEKKYKETYLNVKKQVELSKTTLDQSLDRYINGLTEYLNVLNAQKSYYQLQREEIRIKRQLVSNRVKLYLALGGDMKEEIKKNENINIKLEER